MRCNICDSSLDHPVFNRTLQQWEPCTTCLDIIFHVFGDLPEAKPEEEIPLDTLEEDVYNIF